VGDQVERLVDGIRDALGPNLVGAYLHGSAALGGLRPRSDIDVIVVTVRSMTLGERRGVIDVCLEVSGRPRPVELDFVVQSETKPWRYPPRVDFHYWEGRRADFERGEPAPWDEAANAELAAVITTALAGNSTLSGPPPAEVFDQVPRADYCDALVRNLAEIEDHILELARVWATLESEDVHSKESAAAWALPRLPPEHRPVLERAVAVYHGNADDADVATCAAYVRSEITRAISTAST
jgi:streptomycin 3"-adenylyltransferase